MSELKRSQSQYGQTTRGTPAARRGLPPALQMPLASEAAELRIVDAFEITAAQRGDPYNGFGSRAVAAPRTLRK